MRNRKLGISIRLKKDFQFKDDESQTRLDMAQALRTLDADGRCCGVKPHHYKGGSWRSPPGSPLSICLTCNREFGPDGRQRANDAWDAQGRNLLLLISKEDD